VSDDGGAPDTLVGGAGRSWFFAGTGDAIVNQRAGETVTRV
jgi:hypothetical protein